MKEHCYDAYMGREPYLFASYCHTDTPRVERILRLLFRQGFRIWYDQRGDGIPPATNWEQVINDRLNQSAMFLVFLTNTAAGRRQVIREIRLAIAQSKKDENYRLVFLFLERIPCTSFPEDIQDVLNTIQYIDLRKYGGLTESFVARILDVNLWKDSGIVDDAYRRAYGMERWEQRRPLSDHEKLEKAEELREITGYVYPGAVPELRESNDETGCTFYAVQRGDTAPNAVYPICMDNQWCPPELIREFADMETKNEVMQLQQEEIFRALLHNWQVVVNRASFFNSRIFIHWYEKDGADCDAFAGLLDSGAFVNFLYKEKTPMTVPGHFSIENGPAARWRKLCMSHRLYCLRFDWDENEELNNYENDRNLSDRFQAFCLTTVDDGARLKGLAGMLKLLPEQEEPFGRIWREIQKKASAYSEKHRRNYTRELFYRDFVIREGSDILKCEIDARKPFAAELKQIIDSFYICNLPNALGLRPYFPMGSMFQNFNLESAQTGYRLREVTVGELICSAVEFSPDFLWESVPLLKNEELTLERVRCLRGLKEWNAYMRAIETGQQRARLNELDLFDIAEVWKAYAVWLKKAAEEFPDWNWESSPAAVSVIYRFGSYRLITVYHDASHMEVYTPVQPEADRYKAILTVDYICGDISRSNGRNCMLTEIRLFEGMTDKGADETSKKLLERLRTECRRNYKGEDDAVECGG